MWTKYSVVAKVDAQEENYKTALFLHSIGPDALTIYNDFQFVVDENRDVLAQVIAKFDQHFIGVTNETYERIIFNKRDQEPGENIDSHVMALLNLAKSCHFCECLHDTLTRDRIVLWVRDSQARKRLFQETSKMHNNLP